MFSKMSRNAGFSFSLKLSVMYALFFVVSSLALFGAAYYFINNLVAAREQEVVRDRIREYSAWYAGGGVNAVKNRFNHQSPKARDVFFVRLIGPSNTALFVSIPKGAGSIDFNKISPVNPKPVKGRESWFSINRYGENYWTIGSSSLHGGYMIQVGKNSTESQAFLAHFRSVFFVFVIPLILFGILVGGLLTFRSMRPVRLLVQTVRNILETGERSTRVPVRSDRGELNELVSLFNRMLDKNDALILAMHESLDNVAHDLRTPMTRLRGVAELAMQKPDNKNACFDALGECMEESERVMTMLSTLMDVAEAETGSMRLNLKSVSVGELMESLVDLYEIIADDRNISVISHIPHELSIMADPARIQQVFANLLDNAIKYSPDGSEVKINARDQEDGWVSIAIKDQGMGIGQGEVDKIWDRLYRGDRSRSKRGLGLGLSFVKAIVTAHGGSVAVESEINRGTEFIVLMNSPNGLTGSGLVENGGQVYV